MTPSNTRQRDRAQFAGIDPAQMVVTSLRKCFLSINFNRSFTQLPSFTGSLLCMSNRNVKPRKDWPRLLLPRFKNRLKLMLVLAAKLTRTIKVAAAGTPAGRPRLSLLQDCYKGSGKSRWLKHEKILRLLYVSPLEL